VTDPAAIVARPRTATPPEATTSATGALARRITTAPRTAPALEAT
jgi:hypothetical protein